MVLAVYCLRNFLVHTAGFWKWFDRAVVFACVCTVEALTRLMQCDKAKNEVFNIGSDFEITILELARLVIRVLNSTSTIETMPYEKAYPKGFEDMQRRKPVISKLESFTGFRPKYSLEETILQTADAIKKNNISIEIGGV
jgi:UDP-glucose 4-epimerase